MSGAEGPEWRVGVEQAQRGGIRQVEEDGATFFDVELSAIEAWRFDAATARRIDQPVLYITGGASRDVMGKIADYFCLSVRQTERVVVPGATHSLHHRFPGLVAGEIARFLDRQAGTR